MLESATVINPLGEVLFLDLYEPELSGLEIQDIDGLGPPKAVINTSNVSTVDGVIYNSAQAQNRNIVFKLGLLESPTIEEARQRTYQFFPLKKPVTLLFKTDKRTVVTYGYVEANEPLMFTEDPTNQISIMCPDSYFVDAGDEANVETYFYGVDPKFQFPFSNESTTQPLLEMGRIGSSTSKDVYYPGDTETGFLINIYILGDVGTLTFYNDVTKERIKIDSAIVNTMTGSTLKSGDQVMINTKKGEKSVYLLRNGVRINILNAVGRDVDWLQLTKGINKFAYDAVTGATNLQIRIESQILYEGI